MEKLKPTADCIVARLVPSWGSIISLLFRTTEPYEHYYDEHGEEVPYGAIASWTDVELPPESEDERIREAIEGTIRVYGKTQGQWLDGYDMDTLVFHLREAFDALEEQKEQLASGSSEKPNYHAEWSEEDKNKFELLHTCICRCITDPYWDYSKREKVSKEIIPFIEKLKSLRPQLNIVSTENATEFGNLEYERGVKDGIQSEKSRQWKPSEEQMVALKNVVETYRQRHNVSVGGDCIFIGVESLYNDLKKLM